jgi:hypothetical protein
VGDAANQGDELWSPIEGEVTKFMNTVTFLINFNRSVSVARLSDISSLLQS